MTTKLLAEIEARDPVGRIVTLTVEVEDNSSKLIYTPRLEHGEVLSLNSVFRTGAELPSLYEQSEDDQIFQKIESKLRDNYPKITRHSR